VVIESRLDRRQGPIVVVLVKKGSLSVGEVVWAESAKGKVKAMFDENGQRVKKAFLSQPIGILGFESVPPVGAVVSALKSEIKLPVEEVKKKDSLQEGQEEKDQKPKDQKPGENNQKPEENKKRVELILKADTKGTLEAIKLSMPKQIELISQGVGDINESDVLLSQTTGAGLMGFNVRVSGGVKKLAQVEKIEVKTYEIIYQLLDDLEDRALRLLEPTIDEEVLGEIEVLKEFLIDDGKNKIAGCRVVKGRISRSDSLHLKRGKEIIGDCHLASLRQGKERVDVVKAGEELGILFKKKVDFEPGDMLISFRKLPEK